MVSVICKIEHRKYKLLNLIVKMLYIEFQIATYNHYFIALTIFPYGLVLAFFIKDKHEGFEMYKCNPSKWRIISPTMQCNFPYMVQNWPPY